MFLPVNLFIVLCIIVILVSIDTCTQLCSILLCLFFSLSLSFSLPIEPKFPFSLSLSLSLLFLVASTPVEADFSSTVVDSRVISRVSNCFFIPFCSLFPLSFQNRDTFSLSISGMRECHLSLSVFFFLSIKFGIGSND